MSTKTHRRPAFVATATLLGGIAASLAGNLQAINLGSHQPGIGAYISAIVWPLTLFAVVEVLLHTPWMNNWRDGLTKAMGVGLVGAMAAYISYFHLAHTLSAYGYDVVSRYAGPLAIDAAMVMATLALNRVGHARRAVAVATATPITVHHMPSAIVPVTQEELDDRLDEASLARLDASLSEGGWLARLQAESDGIEPVSAVPVSPAPRSSEVRPESVPADAADLIAAWNSAGPDRPRPGQVDEILAPVFEVTPRTIRRWRDTLKG